MSEFLQDNSVAWAARALDWCVRRHRVISSNIVNRDTPGFHAKDVDFRKVMEQIDTAFEPPLRQTDRRHLPGLFGPPSSVMIVKGTAERLDGNTVNLSQEMSHLVENNYLYQALLKHVNREFKALKLAIQGG